MLPHRKWLRSMFLSFPRIRPMVGVGIKIVDWLVSDAEPGQCRRVRNSLKFH